MYDIKDDGFIDYLESIIPNIDDDNAKGIAKFTVDKGVNSLSIKQIAVLKIGITDYIMDVCPNCGENIVFSEMGTAIIEGICNNCRHNLNKNYTN